MQTLPEPRRGLRTGERLSLSRNAHRIFKCALYYVAIVGGVGSLLLFFGANVFADDAGSAMVLRFFAPTVFLFGFLGVLRGYFQARRTMVPTSVSQLLEQILNAIVSVGGAIVLTNIAGNADSSKRAVYGAVGSSLGTGTGVLTALIFMIIVYLSNKKSIYEKIESDKGSEMTNSDAFKLIITVVTPFILSTCIYNLSGFLNSTIFSRVLSDVRGMAHKGDFGIKFYYDSIDTESTKVTVYSEEYGLYRKANRARIVGMEVGTTFNDEEMFDAPVFTREDSGLFMTDPKKVFNVTINRGSAAAFESHFKLSECNSIEDLENYGNNYYNL